MSIGLISIVLIVLLLVLLGLGIPISFALGFLGVVGLVFFVGISSVFQIAEIAANSGTNLFMLTLPLFVLMAEVFSSSGIGDDLYTAAHNWLSWLPGGLAISSIATCAGFAAISGSSPATAATVGLVSIPEMRKRGYNRYLAAGSVAAGGTLGILIPPSIAMIIYGIITEVSIGKLFIAGIVPGIMLALIFSLAIAISVKMRPNLAPRVQGVSWSIRFSSLKRVWPFIVLAISVIGSIYAGIATPTESAAIGATLAIVIASFYRKLNLKTFHGALKRAISVSAMALFMVIGGNILGFFLTSMAIPQFVTELIVSLNLSRWFVMIMMNFILLFMGCLLDPMAIMVISLPIMFPIITELGFDPVWFGVVTTINVEMGMITPPVGINLFVLKASVPGISMTDIVRGALPFLFLLIFCLALIMIFPPLATWLPGMMMGF